MPIPVLTAAEMKQIESDTTTQYGLSEYDMILQAGEAVFMHAEHLFPDCNGEGEKKWVFLCGKGHNGADALQAALLAHEQGYNAKVFQIASQKGYSPETKRLHERFQQAGLGISFINTVDDLDIPSDVQLIIEGVLGAGLKKEAAGLAAECILRINDTGLPVFSIDLPSGLYTDSAETPLHAAAAATLSLGTPKISSLFYPSRACYGNWHFEKLCFPDKLTASQPSRLSLFTRRDAAAAIPARFFNTHKYSAGKVLVVAGSTGMHGAPVMAALSAMRAGAGMVRLAVPAALHTTVCRHLLEIITIPVGDEHSVNFTSAHAEELASHLEWADVVLLGPGLGKHPDTLQFLNTLMMRAPQRMVIDGDGLRLFSPENKAGRPAYNSSEILATPHAGEFSRIGGRYCYEKPLELIESLRQTATELDINILLKGPTNLLACRDACCTVLPFGDPGLATAGTGDVLAGVTAGLFCRLDVKHAAGAGVAVHSQASRLVQQTGAALSLMAGDLITCLPAAFKVLAEIPGKKNTQRRPS